MRQTSTTLAPTRERRLAKKELLRIMACADSYARRFILEEAHARRLGLHGFHPHLPKQALAGTQQGLKSVLLCQCPR